MIKNYLIRVLNRNASKWVVLVIDIILVYISFIFAYFIRFNTTLDFNIDALIYQSPTILVVALSSFFVVGSYKGIIRHTGNRDVLNVFAATLLMAFVMLSFVVFSRIFHIFNLFIIPISVIIIHYFVNTFVLIVSRFIFKSLYEIISTDLKEVNNVLIFGAGDSGMITYGALNKDTKENYEVIGFIDDDNHKIGKKINRLKIFSIDQIDQNFIDKNLITEVIISIQNLKPSRLLEVTDHFIQYGIEVKLVPRLSKWIGRSLEVSQIKQVNIEDLLDRAPIDISNPIVRRDVNDKVVLVTGAAGSIGSEISRQLSNYSYKKLILLDQAESPLYDLQQEIEDKSKILFIVGDVRDQHRMEAIFKTHKPDKVFHAAAYKHVPLMEENPYEAIKINVEGTKNIIDLSVAYQVDRFVMISTDKAVNPTNVMGATKRIAEMYVTCMSKVASKTKFTTTRFGNVLGSNGSVIPLFKKQLLKGGPLTVTHKEITRYFMTIPEACQLVLEAGTMGEGGEIYIFDMGKAMKIFDIAKRMIYLSGLKYPEDVNIEITGLRPGEKLYEELLNNGENTQPTYHKRIMIASTQKIDYDKVKLQISTLCNLNSNLHNKNQTVELMKLIVPEYISNNSIYSKFDQKQVSVYSE